MTTTRREAFRLTADEHEALATNENLIEVLDRCCGRSAWS